MDNSSNRFARFGEDLYNVLIPALADFSAALQGTIAIPQSIGSTDIAAYLHGNYRFTDTLELTGGLRFTDSEKDVDWRQINSPADPATAAALEVAQAPGVMFGAIDYSQIVDERTESNVSPTIGLNWFVADDVMIFGRYSRGFKSGGYNTDFATAGLEFFEYTDESVDSFELGLKMTLLDATLRLNATLFSMQFEDFQVFQFLLNSQGEVALQLSNAAEATSEGLEFETNWLATDRLEFALNLTLLNTEYDVFENPGDPSLPPFTGNKLSFAPDLKSYVSAQYTQLIGDAGDLRFFVDYAYVDESFSDPSNGPDFRMDSYDLVNARITWLPSGKNWELSLWGKNLADETYHRINNQNFLQTPRTIWGVPRTYGARFTWFAN
jgi:iron complex outermembrane receptor protein